MPDNLSLDLACPVCLETFRRPELMKRHTLSHSDGKPHLCQFCSTRYKRSDALRRHWKTCTERIAAGIAVPGRSAPGKRKQACDPCTSRKRACSTGKPCSECCMRETECTYHGAQGLRARSLAVVEDDGPNRETTNDVNGARIAQFPGPEVVGPQQDLDCRPQSPSSPRIRFPFLSNFTRATGLNQAYNPITSNAAGNVVASNPFDCYLDELDMSLLMDSDYIATDNPTLVLMAEKSKILWDSLHSILNSPECKCPAVSRTDWLRFFTPTNLTRYLHLFWTSWYQHCPIIHQATFDLRNCSPLLFAAMSLIGACMSSLDLDTQNVKDMLDPIEELVFSHSLFSETAQVGPRKGSLLRTPENIQALQATCFLCLLQKWEGNPQAKLRMQRYRFTILVAATRAMGLPQAIHHPTILPSTFGIDEWKEYILTAELIRTINHVFLLDSAFVIFHNSVPRMVLQEMNIDLTCPDPMFLAASPEEFLKATNVQQNRATPIILTDCVRNLCAEHPDPDIIAHLHRESPLNLFTIATAIHGLIFHQLRAFSPHPLFPDPLKVALDRWEDSWASSMQQLRMSPQDSRYRSFPLHAREFAALARGHIEKCYLSQEWHKTLQDLPQHVQSERRDNLATFDQTGMDEAANLIHMVEHLNLN